MEKDNSMETVKTEPKAAQGGFFKLIPMSTNSQSSRDSSEDESEGNVKDQ
jgi:hypothetical protein